MIFYCLKTKGNISYWKVFNDDIKYTPIKKSEIMGGVGWRGWTKQNIISHVSWINDAYRKNLTQSRSNREIPCRLFFCLSPKNILKTISLPAWVIRFKQAFSSNQFWIFTLENSILVPLCFLNQIFQLNYINS